METKTLVEILKNCAEIGAYIAALAFFLYKARSGYLIVDMSVKLACERKRKPGYENKDYLAVSTTIKKGERGGVQLHDAQVRLRPQVQNGSPTIGPVDLITIERVDRTGLEPDSSGSEKPDRRPRRARIRWTEVPSGVPRLNLPPGDETQLTALFEVDANTPYVVEAVILARRIFLGVFNRRFGQWRANSVSLPVQPLPQNGDQAAADLGKAADPKAV